ncbi:putative peptide zinc metalloprotease protein [Alteromonadaceae bacterium Bs31]|nr:putative peptide zinc metalloprotease protein [Alteromonadaceae bacterium Bs31]
MPGNSNLWQQLVIMKPSLPRHVEIQPRHYNGELWYILEDKANSRFHRFNTLAYQLLGFMNGNNNLEQILGSASQAALNQTLDDIPTQEDLIDLLQYLYVADLMICDFPPQASKLFERRQQKQQQFWHQLIKSPYAWKVTLFNPNRFLQALKPLALLLASPFMAIVWLLAVAYALFLAASNWSEISATQLTDILSPQNLFLLWLTYPVLKAFHELGHGLFTTVWGGHVHEFGVVVILGTPFPYVDATAATGFSSKKQRLMVGCAGMAVELFFAAIALILWLQAEDGVYRSILFNIILIGSISTLFFNGNPLMRFDGYHILCDAAEQPNLAARSIHQIRYFTKRYLYGLKDSYPVTQSWKEGFGLGAYGIAAFVYRLFILLSIVLIIARNFPMLGLMFLVWMAIFQFALPLGKYLMYLLASDELAKRRKRAIAISFFSFVLVVLAALYVPIPHRTFAEGVVWLPESSRIRALASGTVEKSTVKNGGEVSDGDPLLFLSNIDTTAQLLEKQAILKEYKSRYEQAWSLDRSQIQLFEQDIAAIELEISYLQEQVNNLIVRSPSSGRFKQLENHQLEGSFIKEGDTIGLLLNENPPHIRAVLKQEEIGFLRSNLTDIQFRLASQPQRSFTGQISHQVPGGTYTLPSQALGTSGGGRIQIDGKEQNYTRTTERVFIIDIESIQQLDAQQFGHKVYVSFSHKPESLAAKIKRLIQQLVINIMRQGEQPGLNI